jgi:hypothetical protein
MTNTTKNILIIGTIALAGGIALWYYKFQVKKLSLNTLNPEYTEDLENITME